MKPLKLIVFLTFMFSAFHLQAQTLALFDLNNYEGWIYTRSDIPLNTENINLRKIKIFKSSKGDNYALKSPILNCNGAKYVRVKFLYHTANFSQPAYNLTKSSPYIELIDLNDNPLVKNFYLLPQKTLEHEIVVFLEVPQGVQNVKVRFEAPDGDMNSNGAIINALITSSATNSDVMPGDLTGDNIVDVSDVTTLINMILGLLDPNLALADLNHDGNIDVSDVTLLINSILKS